MCEQPLFTTRRGFLGGSLALLSTAAGLPLFLVRTARALAGPGPPARRKNDGARIFVMVQLAGGNDGLNTIIPYDNDLYYEHRRRIAIAKRDVLPLEAGLGLHPAATDLKGLFDDGRLAIVQGVGYPNASRNHFSSTQVWHTAAARLELRPGRLERCFGAGCRVAGRDAGRIRGGGRAGRFGRALQSVTRMIAADSPARVYHACLGGFDTHTGQAGRHRWLLSEFGAAMKAFLKTLKRDKLLDRVLVVAFSEFGRRAPENAAGGTDHGEAGPMFLFGSALRPGIHGKHPDLAQLRRGALRFGCDFRRVYAEILCRWLGINPSKVLGPGFAPLGLIAG